MAKPKSKKLDIESEKGKSEEEQIAHVSLCPSVQAALSLSELNRPEFGNRDLTALRQELSNQMSSVQKGDLSRGEAMLTAQAHTLDAIFNNLARRLQKSKYLNQMESYLKLAMRAQGQSKATWEAIARIQNPSVNYVKQTNIAQNQQINNADRTSEPPSQEMASASAEKNSPNKLLEEEEHERLDTGATTTPIRTDQELETVGAVNRPQNRKRQK